jgi:hypothetical protein
VSKYQELLEKCTEKEIILKNVSKKIPMSPEKTVSRCTFNYISESQNPLWEQ